ncbi:MAG TPA: BON domain-containing protein, partial [Burkholderiales bacterium]|nr:BON domain-containing protein [Burkholderiales bacterium]
MRRNRYAALPALAALLASLALLPGCPALIAGGGLAAFSALEDRRTTGTQIEDQGIESRAATRIGERFKESAHVNVAVFNRAVLLTGEAWDEATRDEVGKIAASVPNVRSVTNEVQVSGLSSATSRANDTTLTAKVRGRFLNAKEFSPLHVKVVTESGVVYLLGLVTEAEGEAATELARTTSGVRKVVKVFDYCRATDELCR